MLMKSLIIVLVLLCFLLLMGYIIGRIRMNLAEHWYPPIGKFLDINGVRLHYTDQGNGPAIVILHGNGSMAKEIHLSEVVKELESTHRVIVIDRPGFGHSARLPHMWEPEQQADLMFGVLDQLGISDAVVMGHSWGTLVAVSMALAQPERVKGLALIGGYYMPVAHPLVPLSAPLLWPVIGPVLRHCVVPVTGDFMLWKGIAACFDPQKVPVYMNFFPGSLALRASQTKASAEDGAYMREAAACLEKRYASLTMPVNIFAGAQDKIVVPAQHSARLHTVLPHSSYTDIPDGGHMLHHTHQDTVITALREMA
jgi:pimeloyl-ACP methyl ester carboxylesterase